MSEVRIRRAEIQEAERLTQLAHLAKSYWGYSDELLALWVDDLTFTPDYVAVHQVYVATEGGHTVGVYALSGDPPELELEHLWVHPGSIGQGVGRVLVTITR